MIHEDPPERARDEAFSMRLIRLGQIISILATTVAAFATIFGSVRGRNEKKFLSGMTRRGNFLKLDYPGTPFNQLLGQNDSGQAVGYYRTKADGTGPDHAYIYDENGSVFELLKIPGSTSAQATGINNSGNSCGFFVDSKGVNHGWVLTGGNFDILNVPGSTGTQALSLNNKGQVVGSYTDSAGNSHGFAYEERTKAFQPVDDPDGVSTTVVNGINDHGDMVGFFGTAPINSGFVATPRNRE